MSSTLSHDCRPCVHFFFFYCYADHRYLHSFPTRRSSDLWRVAVAHLHFNASQRQHHAERAGLLRAEHPRLQSKKRVIGDRKSTRLNSSHSSISYAVFCLKKKK